MSQLQQGNTSGSVPSFMGYDAAQESADYAEPNITGSLSVPNTNGMGNASTLTAKLDEGLRMATPPSSGLPGVMSTLNWSNAVDEAREILLRHLPDLAARRSIGIQDIANASGLSPQQIRRYERYGLISPEYEQTGARRNRRYSHYEALLILIAAHLVRAYKMRPAQAAAIVRTQRAADPGFGRDSSELTSELVQVISGGGGDEGAVARGLEIPDKSLADAALERLRNVIGAQLAVVAVSALLGERDLPPEWVICVRRRSDMSRDSGAIIVDQPAPPDGDAQVRLYVDLLPNAPEPGDAESKDQVFYALAAPHNQIAPFRLPSTFLAEPRRWYRIAMPSNEGHPLEVILGVPNARVASHIDQHLERRLDGGQLLVESDTVDVAKLLLWTVVDTIPSVAFWLYGELFKGTVKLAEAVARDGLDRIVLWLYAHVLKRMVPDVDQCDFLAPESTDRQPSRRDALLTHITSTDLAELLVAPRAQMPSGQLLSGYTFRTGQPCFVESITRARTDLVAFYGHEKAKSAAAIPVILDDQPLASVYLCSREKELHFTTSMKRALCVAANQAAEILWRDRRIADHTSRSIIDLVRPHAVNDFHVLQDVFREWVGDIVKSEDSAGSDFKQLHEGEVDGEGDHRLVCVVVGASPNSKARLHPDVRTWLQQQAREAADKLAELLDYNAYAHEGYRAITPGINITSTNDDSDMQVRSSLPFARIFGIRGPSEKARNAGVDGYDAYVVLVPGDCSWEDVDWLKRQVRLWGYDGTVPATTQAGGEIGSVVAWVLDTKRSYVQHALARIPGVDGIQEQADRVTHDVQACVRLLPYLHRFHREAFVEGNLNRAIATLREARALDKDDIYVVRHLLDLYLRADKLDDATALARECAHLDAVMPAKWFASMGQLCLMLGQAEEGLAYAERAIQLDPSHPWPYRVAGEAHLAMEHFDKAAGSFQQAAAREQSRGEHDSRERDDRMLGSLLLAAQALMQGGEFKQALEVFDDIMANHPQLAKERILVHQGVVTAQRHLHSAPR